MHKEIELISKRNRVLRVTSGTGTHIRKEYSELKRYTTELSMLISLIEAGVNVPKLLLAGQNYIIMEDLGNTTLLDWMEKSEKNGEANYENVIYALADMLKTYYEASKRIFGESMALFDMNFRNFLIKDDVIYRVDFEQVTAGKAESDIGKLLAFSTSYEPVNTPWKINFRRKLLMVLANELGLDIRVIIEEERKESKRMERRRQKNVL